MNIGGNGWGKALWRHVSSDFMKDFLGFFPCENISCPNCRQVPNENQPTQKRRQKTLQKNGCQNFWAKKSFRKGKKTTVTANSQHLSHVRSETGPPELTAKKNSALNPPNHPSQFLSYFFSFSNMWGFPKIMVPPNHPF